MSNSRPTFSEFWHRVQSLHPRLRSHVRVTRSRHRGRSAWVLHDPATDRFIRVGEAAWAFAGLLDGRRTVGEAWEHCSIREGVDLDHSPTQGEALQVLGQLYQAGMIQAEVSPDVDAMFERMTRARRKEQLGWLMNLMFAKFRLFNPDRIFDALVRPLGWLFSRWGLALWAAWMLLTLWHGAKHWEALMAAAWGDSHNPGAVRMLTEGKMSAGDLWLMSAVMLGLKLIHEIGHGLACKRLSADEGKIGTVNEAAIRLMMMVPSPCVDVTSAWNLASKWRRAWVGAAGMYVEMIAGAAAVWVFAATGPDAIAHKVALQAILLVVASVVLFNANPLVRFDGYYILSDLLGIPNLATRAKAELLWLVKRYGFGILQAKSTAWNNAERPWLILYGIGSSIYSVVLGVSIAWVTSNQMLILGVVLAIMGVFGWGVMPICKGAWYLLTNPELDRHRIRALTVTAVALGIPLGLASFYPLPDRARAEGVLHLKQQGIYAREAGWVVRHATIGSRVTAGQELAKLDNPELETQREQAVAELREAEIKRDKAQGEEAQAVAAAEAAKARAAQGKLEELDRRLSRLTILAPQDGLFYAQPLDGMEGVWIEAGHPLGQVVDPQETRIWASLPQDSGARIAEADKTRVEARLREAPGCQEDGTLEAFAIEGRKELPAQALADQAGGNITLDPHEQGKTQRHITQAVVRLQGQGNLPRVDGLPVEVRFTMGRTPALRMLWRWTLTQFQRRDR